MISKCNESAEKGKSDNEEPKGAPSKELYETQPFSISPFIVRAEIIPSPAYKNGILKSACHRRKIITKKNTVKLAVTA